MPSITLQRVFWGSVTSAQPLLTVDDLQFYCAIVGTAGGPAGTFNPSSLDSTGQPCNLWIGFDIHTIPATATIQTATLRMQTFYANPNLGVYDGIDVNIQCLNDDNSYMQTDLLQYNNESSAYLNAHTTTYNLDTVSAYVIDMNADVKTDLITRRTFNYVNPNIYFRLVSNNTSEGVNFDSLNIYLDVTYTMPASGALFFGSD